MLSQAVRLTSTAVLVAALVHEVIAGIAGRAPPGVTLFLATRLTGLFLTGDIFNFYVFFETALNPNARVLSTPPFSAVGKTKPHFYLGAGNFGARRAHSS